MIFTVKINRLEKNILPANKSINKYPLHYVRFINKAYYDLKIFPMYKLVCIIFSTVLLFIFSENKTAAQSRHHSKHRKATSSSLPNANDSSIIKTSAPSFPKEIIIKYGVASFYAQKFNGRQTANGNTFSSVKYTAACNVLPLGTWVKVTNLKNDKSVIVFINDRLHPKNKRLIDLSKTAAELLGFVSMGITKVKVEVLGKLHRK
jgi:rare lipoprotein A